jgi:hypothetical protein
MSPRGQERGRRGIPAARSRASKLYAPPYKKPPQLVFSLFRRRLGTFPQNPPRALSCRGRKEEFGAAEEGRPWRIQEQHVFAVDRPWRSPKPSCRWTTRSSSSLQERPPEGGCPCVYREAAGAVQAADDPPSPSRPPCFLFTVLFSCLGPNRTSTPPPRRRVQERKVSLPPPSPCCAPGLRAEAEPSLVSLLSSVSFLDRCSAPRHRADPPSLESRPSSRAGLFAGAAAIVATRSLALQWCRSFVPTSARRVPARHRHPHRCAAFVWHALARTPEGLNPSVLPCNLFTHVLPWVQSSTFSGLGIHGQHTHRSGPECRCRRPVFAALVLSRGAVVLDLELHR